MNDAAGVHADLFARHRKVMPDWIALLYEHPIELVRGEGRYVWDGEGNRYLDFFGGILVTSAGHNVPEVVDAIREQAGRILHTSTLYLIRPMIELAEKIAELAPMPDAKVFFLNSGSEATDTAILLACTYRNSNQVLALRNSYHGRTFTSLAVTGNRFWAATGNTGIGVSYVHPGDNLRGPFQGLPEGEVVRRCAADFRSVLDTATAGRVAGLIVEPVQGVGGYHVPPPRLLAAYKEMLDEDGALLIADEVQTGWGRTGETFWGIESHGVTPDIVTFAKGAGNGLALGGVIARPEIMDSIRVQSISTFGGNPLVTAGGMANLDFILAADLQSNAQRVGTRMLDRIRGLTDAHPEIIDVRGKGLMASIEFVHPGHGSTALTPAPAPELATAVVESCRERGLLIGKGGLYSNCARIAPPMSVTLGEADAACDIIAAAARDVLGEPIGSR